MKRGFGGFGGFEGFEGFEGFGGFGGFEGFERFEGSAPYGLWLSAVKKRKHFTARDPRYMLLSP
jgi:hypothetical protein